ncbi:pyridoxamine 5'-phosphate oxidase family protein [Pseudomonas sp. NA-150]|uniref:pyridoxamine 5'-phosphate oxidase family protein n=1 Tax=Pseudomonas sp. NA-150 TaxID=3367525 RepID=UPI0037CB154B
MSKIEGTCHPDPTAVFHPGEQKIQEAFGVRQQVARMGHRAIVPYIDEYFQDFYARLNYVVLAANDGNGQLWATLLLGEPGIITSPDPHSLQIRAEFDAQDPVGSALYAGAALAVLGIDFASKGRLRAGGHVSAPVHHGLLRIAVNQSYGNCPKYIWPRRPPEPSATNAVPTHDWTRLDDPRVRSIIEHANTFFIASQHDDPQMPQASGLDVSHRGGQTGLLQIQDAALIWPEYQGNYFFNTLGNLVLNPSCGLLILDFDSGSVVQLTGSAAIIWLDEQDPKVEGNAQVNCKVRFIPDKVLLRSHAMAGGWRSFDSAYGTLGYL